MPDKKPEWSDYSYSNSDIAKRLGISTEKVEDLKAEAAKESQGEIGGDLSKNGVTAGLKINKDDLKIESARVGIEIPGLGGVSIDSQGGGEIDILSLIKIESIRIKCFYIQRFYLAGQFLFSDIQKIDSEECRDSEEPEPEPEPDPSLDDIDDDPKPRPSPKIPPYSVDQGGIYTIKRTIFERIVNDSIKYLSIYKGFVSSNAIRMYFHESPVLDLWQINTQVRVSHEIVNPKPIEAPFSYSADRTIYYCEYPETLASRNIITRGAIDNYEYPYRYQNIVVLHSSWVLTLKRDTPYGRVVYNPKHDGVSSHNRKFASLLGTWAGGVILEGNSQSVPYFLRNGFVSRVNEENYTYYHMVETNQYIDFLSLISPRNITNSPIDLRPKPMDDEKCCCDLIKKLAKYQGLGQKTGSINIKDNKIEEKGGDDIFPLKIPKRWIDRESKPKDDYEIKNMRHLILSIGIMLDRFEELFNPSGKDSAFPLKKPEDGIWKWLPGDGGDYEVPDPNYDPKKSKEDGKIKNKKLKIETYLDLFRYFLESQIRLEMLFPIAQIRDSKISKRLIYPKAKGEIKINDLIQFQELLLLYINKTLGDPSGSVIIKDADPTKEGDQPITIENFDISDMLRKLIRFSVDINSDIDLANNFGKRTLYQLLSAMQVLVKNHEMTEAIFEDLGMQEEQSFVPVKFFADPYAGAWKSGEGFDPNKVRVENSEKAIEENLEAFLQEKEVEVKVSRRAKTETSDLRDLLAQIGRYAAELAAQGKIPNTPQAIQQAIDKARFELQTESALRRTDIRQASAAGRARTKRNKKKQ